LALQNVSVSWPLDYSESEEYDNDGDHMIPGRWSSARLQQSPVTHGTALVVFRRFTRCVG
jgi:hypothetical protein